MKAGEREALRQIVLQWLDRQGGWVTVDARNLPPGCKLDDVKDAMYTMYGDGLTVVRAFNNGTMWKVVTRKSAETAIAAIKAWQRNPSDDPPFAHSLPALRNSDRMMAESHDQLREYHGVLEELVPRDAT